MNNPLIAPVQIVFFPARIVYYEPTGFPGIETSAELVSMEGDHVTVFKGYEYETIHASQVKSYESIRAYEQNEARDVEAAEYDQREGFGIQ